MPKRYTHDIRRYKGFSQLSDKQKQVFLNIFSVVSGGSGDFFESADSIHLAKLGRITSILAQMDSAERERFIRWNWIGFEEIFENSEAIRISDRPTKLESETANSLIDNLYNDLIYNYSVRN